jgi:hypothetical protein
VFWAVGGRGEGSGGAEKMLLRVRGQGGERCTLSLPLWTGSDLAGLEANT